MMLYVNTVVLYVNMLLYVRMMFYVSTRWRRGKVRMMVSGGWQCDDDFRYDGVWWMAV